MLCYRGFEIEDSMGSRATRAVRVNNDGTRTELVGWGTAGARIAVDTQVAREAQAVFTVKVQYGYATRSGPEVTARYAVQRVNTDTAMSRGTSESYARRRYSELAGMHRFETIAVHMTTVVDHVTGRRTQTVFYRDADGLLNFVRVILAPPVTPAPTRGPLSRRPL